jgi:hypothetical protein
MQKWRIQTSATEIIFILIPTIRLLLLLLLLLADLNLVSLRLLNPDHEDTIRGQIGGHVLRLASRRHAVPETIFYVNYLPTNNLNMK